MGKIKLRKRMVDCLRFKFYGMRGGLGLSRDELKQAGNAHEKIVSRGTFNTYHQQVDRYADWCKVHFVTDFDEAQIMVSEYLKEMISKGYAAATIKTMASALGKVWDCDYRAFGVELPKCERAAITRSRMSVKRDKHFSVERNMELINFGACSGLRRAELSHIAGTDLYQRDGKFFLHIRGKEVGAKGGKVREVELIGSDQELRNIVKRMKLAGDGLVWPYVHSAFDEHAQRNVYSWRVYNKYARDVNTLQRSEIYACRADRAGEKFDRRALELVSKYLGHGHQNKNGKWVPRAEITVRNYLH